MYPTMYPTMHSPMSHQSPMPLPQSEQKTEIYSVSNTLNAPETNTPINTEQKVITYMSSLLNETIPLNKNIETNTKTINDNITKCTKDIMHELKSNDANIHKYNQKLSEQFGTASENAFKLILEEMKHLKNGLEDVTNTLSYRMNTRHNELLKQLQSDNLKLKNEIKEEQKVQILSLRTQIQSQHDTILELRKLMQTQQEQHEALQMSESVSRQRLHEQYYKQYESYSALKIRMDRMQRSIDNRDTVYKSSLTMEHNLCTKTSTSDYKTNVENDDVKNGEETDEIIGGSNYDKLQSVSTLGQHIYTESTPTKPVHKGDIDDTNTISSKPVQNDGATDHTTDDSDNDKGRTVHAVPNGINPKKCTIINDKKTELNERNTKTKCAIIDDKKAKTKGRNTKKKYAIIDDKKVASNGRNTEQYGELNEGKKKTNHVEKKRKYGIGDDESLCSVESNGRNPKKCAILNDKETELNERNTKTKRAITDDKKVETNGRNTKKKKNVRSNKGGLNNVEVNNEGEKKGKWNVVEGKNKRKRKRKRKNTAILQTTQKPKSSTAAPRPQYVTNQVYLKQSNYTEPTNVSHQNTQQYNETYHGSGIYKQQYEANDYYQYDHEQQYGHGRYQSGYYAQSGSEYSQQQSQYKKQHHSRVLRGYHYA